MSKTENGLTDAQSAAAIIGQAQSALQVTTGGGPGADLPGVAFDRLSVERRVLGHITDEVDSDAFGPRNTLAALTYALMTDRNTTHPPAGWPRLEVEGLGTEEIAQSVLDHLGRLEAAGLCAKREDGSYEVTEAGFTELSS